VLVAVVERVRRIDGSGCAPVGVLVDQPATWAHALRHLPDRLLLLAHEMKQRQARADQIERTRTERLERVLENVVLAHLEIRKLEPLQVAGVDVGRDHLPGRTDLLGQPHRHRAAPRRDLQTPPAGLNQRPPPARHWIVELLEKRQPLFLGRRPTRGSKAIARLSVDSLCTRGGGPRLRHGDNLASGTGSSKRVCARLERLSRLSRSGSRRWQGGCRPRWERVWRS
jgi:hypothetical protein